ncbi:MAG: class I SAM-dependent methyltransferase, partial [Arenimonas sp.]
MKCRFCETELTDVFLDLGSAPPSNAFITEADLAEPELYFPLRLHTCRKCLLVQVDEVQKHDALFSSDYVYFSSFSSTWLKHAENYVDVATKKLALDQNSLVMEIASNDGYLLQYFKQRNIPCL